MKRRVLQLMLAWVAGCFFLVSGVALAQSPASGDDSSIMEQLNLDAAQKAKLKGLREKFLKETEALRNDIKQLLKEERELKKSSETDESLLRNKMKERADKEIELTLALTRFNEQVEAILTDKQKQKLKEMRSGRN